MTTVWFRVKDLDAARTFYRRTLGFEEAYVLLEAGEKALEVGILVVVRDPALPL